MVGVGYMWFSLGYMLLIKAIYGWFGLYVVGVGYMWLVWAIYGWFGLNMVD